MKKSLLSCLMALSILLVSTAPALASNRESELPQVPATTVICLADDFDDTMIAQIENGIAAYATDADGNIVQLDCEVTIREIPQSRSAENVDGVQYSMEIEARTEELKVKSNTGDKNTSTITCSASITMEWLDRTGTRNAIKRLYGGSNMIKGTQYGGRVAWGYDHNYLIKKTLSGNGSSFDFDPKYDLEDSEGTPTFGNLHAHYELEFDNDDKYDMMVCVAPTIFD